jgi:hypothetical protein
MLTVLPAAARKCLEEVMVIKDYEFQSDFYRRRISAAAAEAAAKAAAEAAVEAAVEAEARGGVRGQANAVLTILDARGIAVPDGVRAEIAECTDHDKLDRWIRRAATATKIEDLGD